MPGTQSDLVAAMRVKDFKTCGGRTALGQCEESPGPPILALAPFLQCSQTALHHLHTFKAMQKLILLSEGYVRVND